MFTDINVTLHMYECPVLGGTQHWDWRQNHNSAPFWRLYWNRTPGAFVTVDNTEWSLTPDYVFLMSPGTFYSSRTENEVEHFYVHFSADSPFDAVAPGLFQFDSKLLQALATEAVSSFMTDRFDWRTVFKIKVMVMSALLHLQDETVPPQKQYDVRIKGALALMNSNYNICNRKLAAHVGMSLNSFLTLFQNETNMTPQAWLRRKRLDHACEMLHFSKTSIEEIAEMVGFCDRFHFSRAFKNAYAMGPAEYRQQAQFLRDAGKIKRET